MAQCENRKRSAEPLSKTKRRPKEWEQDEEAGKPGPSELPLGGAASDDSSSSLAVVDNPEAPPCEVVSLDDSEQEEEEREEPALSPPAHSPPASPSSPILRKAKQRRLACDEVSSTSELAPAIKTETPCRSGLAPVGPPCGSVSDDSLRSFIAHRESHAHRPASLQRAQTLHRQSHHLALQAGNVSLTPVTSVPTEKPGHLRGAASRVCSVSALLTLRVPATD